jgi:pimeloyl-[acyl-carrier protein] synthase
MSNIVLEDFDPFSPENWNNPHPLYHQLRETEPMHQMATGEWILTRWADCFEILRDPRWSSNPEHRREQRDLADMSTRESLNDGDFPVILFLDPPDHTRIRGLLSPAFTRRAVERLRPHVQEIVDDLLDDLEGQGPVDLISKFAYALPVIVICELMGVPAEDRHLFHGWSDDASRLLDGDLDEETVQKGLTAAMMLLSYLDPLIEERRTTPRDDLLSMLVSAQQEGDQLTDQELRANTLTLFIAGHETTMNLIGNGCRALLSHRSEWDRLVAEPTLIEPTVEECLRYDGPVHVTGRIPTEDIEIAGHLFAAGDQVVTHLAAANRDPARFPDPDRFDIGRQDNQHLSFSLGMHHCLGAWLARLEGQVALGTLARRFPDLDLATDDLNYRDHFVLRGLRELPVNLG